MEGLDGVLYDKDSDEDPCSLFLALKKAVLLPEFILGSTGGESASILTPIRLLIFSLKLAIAGK